MVEKTTTEKIVKVKNRNNGNTGYSIPELHLWRDFEPGAERNISLEELNVLKNQPGGEYVLKNCLIIEDKSALEYLDMEVEPEYFYTEKEIRELLTTGTLDELLDFLDFAPQGAIDICKDISVEIELPDTNKRKAILDKTGFDINTILMTKKILEDEDEEKKDKSSDKKTRRVQKDGAEEKGGRRTTPKYKVITD